MSRVDDFNPDSNSVRNEFQSRKGSLHRQVITTPILADPDRLKSGQASSASLVTTVTTFLAQPDVPRNITITPTGTTADVKAGDYVITGTDIRDNVITDTITMVDNASTLQSGLKAFKTVTSVLIPVQDGAGATFDIGVGDVLGLDRLMAGNEVLAVTLAGVYETTRPTVVTSATVIASNTIDINGTLDGAKTVVVDMVTTELY